MCEPAGTGDTDTNVTQTCAGYGLLKGEFCAKMTIKGVGCYGQEIEGVLGHICYKLSATGRCARANEGYNSSLGTV